MLSPRQAPMTTGPSHRGLGTGVVDQDAAGQRHREQAGSAPDPERDRDTPGHQHHGEQHRNAQRHNAAGDRTRRPLAGVDLTIEDVVEHDAREIQTARRQHDRPRTVAGT